MKKTGMIALVGLAVVVAAALAASQLVRDSSSAIAPPPVGTPSPVDVTVGLEPDRSVGIDGRSVEELPGEGYVAGGTFGGDDVAPPLPELSGRKIIRNASISLGVEDVLASVQRVESIATGAGGFVSESSVFVEPPVEPLREEIERPRPTQSATVTIRVPASSYASVMQQLRDIAGAEVQSETSTSSDVSEEFADLQARLRNLEATEARYLELLGRAEAIPDILALQDRINGVRLEIERTQGRINLLNDLTDLATISVHLRPLALVETPSEPGWAQQAWENAWGTSQDVLEGLGTAAIVAGVVLAWLAVPALAIIIGWRVLKPRREGSGQT